MEELSQIELICLVRFLLFVIGCLSVYIIYLKLHYVKIYTNEYWSIIGATVYVRYENSLYYLIKDSCLMRMNKLIDEYHKLNTTLHNDKK